jgi:large repetitive protein
LATVAFSGSDAREVASFECKLDGGSFQSCPSPKAYSGLKKGSHTFEVRAVDAAGNVDPTPASRSWTVKKKKKKRK